MCLIECGTHCSLKIETKNSEFDGIERLFMKNKCVCAFRAPTFYGKHLGYSLNDNSKNKKHLLHKEISFPKIGAFIKNKCVCALECFFRNAKKAT